MKTKIYYSTWYDDTDKICGYVWAIDRGNYFTINQSQYNRALKKRTIGGTAGIKWHTEKYKVGNEIKEVYIVDKNNRR